MKVKIKKDSQRIENYSLTVDLVKAEDSGEYEVRATNEMGSAISKSTVTVQSKLKPPRPKSNLEIAFSRLRFISKFGVLKELLHGVIPSQFIIFYLFYKTSKY